MSKNQISLGADPEIFVADKTVFNELSEQSKGSRKISQLYTPICGRLGGTKVAPMQMGGLPKGFMQQEDGAAVEFNIPPVYNAEDFCKNITTATTHLQKVLSKQGLSMLTTNSIILTDDVLQKFPNLDAIGCDPDYSAYTAGAIPRGAIPEKYKRIRGAGGHLHIGYNKETIPADVLVKFLDLVLCLPNLANDKQFGRRSWWGQAGVYRPKPYGVEYRTLSNFWVLDAHKMYVIASAVFELMESLGRNMIEWSALYNATNWDALKLLVYAEDVKGSQEFLGHLCKYHKVLSNLISSLARF